MEGLLLRRRILDGKVVHSKTIDLNIYKTVIKIKMNVFIHERKMLSSLCYLEDN